MLDQFEMNASPFRVPFWSLVGLIVLAAVGILHLLERSYPVARYPTPEQASNDTLRATKQLGVRVAVIGTREYGEIVGQFKIGREEARERMIQYQREQGGRVIILGHSLVIGGDYVFSGPCKIGFAMGGFYVSGSSGQVRWVETPDVLLASEYPLWAKIAPMVGGY